jgi:hypothetical protein
LHLERHGDEAVAKARDMVRNLKERGDNEAADTWLRIIARSRKLHHGVTQHLQARYRRIPYGFRNAVSAS